MSSSWLQPALVATISNTVILSMVYLYLYIKEKEHSLFLFFISWSVYSLRFVAMFFYIYVESPALLIMNQALVIISSHLLFVAFNTWLGKKPSPLSINIASSSCLLWVFGIGFFKLPFTQYTIPVFFYVGILYIAIGIILLWSGHKKMSGVRIISVTLILWGLHKIDYPFLRPVDWFAPWGYLIGAIAAVITAIGMILIYFETTKNSLNELLREKEILIREVHHRVKNNLSVLHSLLNHNIATVTEPSTRDILKKIEDKIFAFALIHTLLHKSESVENIDFKRYIHDFARHIVDSYGASEEILSFDLGTNSLILDIDYAKNLGLIFNELLTNALKHAFRDDTSIHIDIKLQEVSGHTYELIIRDNGRGLPDDIDMDSRKMSGLYLVRMLCEDIGARMELYNREGTVALITFSHPKQEKQS